MSFPPGTRLGPYEIVALLGQGGMGEVYRARDTRLNRDVAIKTSRAKFSERFAQEARAIAALNHPHICQLYDVGPDYLVMELVHGTPVKGPLPLNKTLKLAIQLAGAIEAAHRQSITHRDLKPANILNTKTGIKVLDFGLAKIEPAKPAGSDAATVTKALTQEGAIVGTLHYMAPEQLNGKEVDSRADLFSFGCVLYEMLTGSRAFEGATAASVIAAVLEREVPPVGNVAPTALDRLLNRCLAKDPDDRWQSAGDIRAELEWIAAGGGAEASIAKTGQVWPAVTAVVTLIAGLLAFLYFRANRYEMPGPVRFQIALPDKVVLPTTGNFAVSPNGRRLAFAAAGADGQMLIWLREMDSLEAKPLAATKGFQGQPFFWSSDSRFIAFRAVEKLKKLEIAGGPPETLCDVPDGAIGGSWNRDGVIIFGTQPGAVMRVSAAGGTPSPLTVLDQQRREFTHVYPVFLPDGRHFLYLRLRGTGAENDGLYAGELATRPAEQSKRRILVTSMAVNYVPPSGTGPGQLLFWRDGALMAQPFDAGRLELTGDPVPVADQLGFFRGFAFFSASANGVLVYRGALAGIRLSWFDRQGKQIGGIDRPGDYVEGSLSPDGSRVAVARLGKTNVDIWLFDSAGRGGTRFTFDSAFHRSPVWSADGKRVFLSCNRSGNYDLYFKEVDGEGDEQLLLQSSEDKFATSSSRDGRFLLYTVRDPNTGYNIQVLPLEGDRKPFSFLSTPFNESEAVFSPDGHWVAYTSDETGTNEVYVRAFAPPEAPGPSPASGKWPISKNGGSAPQWTADGRELTWRAGGTVMGVAVTMGPAFHASEPKPLFEVGGRAAVGAMTADGKRFLFAVPAVDGPPPPFNVVLNWQAGLKK